MLVLGWMLAREAIEAPKTNKQKRPITIDVGYIPELDGKTLLPKMSHGLIIGLRK